MEKHTMRDYVLQTPAVLRRLLTEHWEAPLAAAFTARPVRILRLVASGSSYNAALCVRPYLRKWLSCEVLITEPFTFCTYECQQPEDELAVVISQSGYSTNALQALDAIRAKGRTAIGITSDPASDLRLHADLLIDYGCGPESVGYVTMGCHVVGTVSVPVCPASSLRRRAAVRRRACRRAGEALPAGRRLRAGHPGRGDPAARPL